MINDPDCAADPAGGPDLCSNPNATGVIGIRKSQPAGPQGPTLYGVACASCHAGINPLNPPAATSEPSWDNIHATNGNMYLKTGRIFSANLDPLDRRKPMFDAWPDGTVDTTLLFSDGNPGAITAIWEQDDRPTFHVHYSVDGGATTVDGDGICRAPIECEAKCEARC